MLVVNYRGSIGFGKESMNSLLGNIGDNDVQDCGNLAKKALKQFPDIVDADRLCVYGGSHGGFMTGWLIGHPDFKDMWAVAGVRNPVLDMSYMVTATDIPDWIYACSLKTEIGFADYDVDKNRQFFLKSPISQIKNVKTPCIFQIGSFDQRVPPHQSYFYYNALKEKGVDCRLYDYPATGHALADSVEVSHDWQINLSLWMAKYAVMPFLYRPKERSFIMIKPDGVQRGLIGATISKFETRGFKLVAMKVAQPGKAMFEKHYADLSSKGFFKGLIEYAASGPVCCMVWEGDNVVKTSRKILGATKPSDSEPGTLRGDLCIDVGRNVIHGSDSVDSANKEIQLWFAQEELVQWTNHSKSWVYEEPVAAPSKVQSVAAAGAPAAKAQAPAAA